MTFGRARVGLEHDGERLDRVLPQLWSALSRVRAQELIRDGGVRVNGHPAERPAQLVASGDELEVVEVPSSRLRAGGSVAAELVVLFEDEHLAVVDKPAGQIVHPTSVVRGGTVSELAVARFGKLPAPQGGDRPGIVHRLDADTSGLLVVAKSQEAAEPLVEMFRQRGVEKRYLALVAGEPRFESDWIRSTLGRAQRRSDRVMVLPEGEGRPAETFYTVQERFERFALLECRPRTGRTHQIRVHLAHVELPVVGDKLYTGRSRRPLPAGAPAASRHMLHAAGLEFAHPVSGAALNFESPIPQDFARWLAWLREGASGV
jgi:23S rRNA pseudouridine1911/1915/1917 synthase